MKNVFIDTNIWLSLYHFTNDDLTQFEKLKDMLGKSINLIVPRQVYDEITRNREAKVMDALKSFDLKIPKYPVFCKGYDDFEQLQKDLSEIEKKFSSFKQKIESDITEEELPADKTLQNFFSIIELIPCDDYIEKAYNRYRMGNPPGKDNKYGDAVNWECLLSNVPNGEDLYFISADKDYRSLVYHENMNPFLIKEWEYKKDSKIYFYSTLVGFLNTHIKEIQLQDEEDKQTLIEDLYNSRSFHTTHKLIASLKNYSEWTEQQIETLCFALIDNNQVQWIIEDPDVFDFYHTILSNVKCNEMGNASIKQSINILKDVESTTRSYCEAERDEAFEEYHKY